MIRKVRRWNATLDLPLRRLGPGLYETGDGRWQILYHWTHRMWFIADAATGEDQNYSEWFDTLWEARESLYKAEYRDA